MSKLNLAVDIDETLAHTNLFWARHHLQAYGNPEDLTAEAIISKYRFVKDVPYWQSEDAHLWVEAHVYSNEAKLEIPVIEEAIEVMQDIPVACYLTNRPLGTIEGTQKWLRKHGFPDREIIASNNGIGWKARTLEEMFPDVTGIIDDNHELLEHLQPNYSGRIFLYSSSEFKNNRLDVILCPTWADVRREVYTDK